MTWWPFKRRKIAAKIAAEMEDERPISAIEVGQMWIEANRKAQQRFYDFLAEAGLKPSEEQLAADQARMKTVTREAQEYVSTRI